MSTIRSSYKMQNLSYDHIFQLLCFMIQPKKVVEFGILDGFSLQCFVKYCHPSTCQIYAYDIFDDFIGNHADQKHLTNLFSQNENVTIEKKDFYKSFDQFKDKSIDLLHIDIANTGDVYKFSIEKYLQKISDNGVLVLEGGSEDRDQVWWMKKYNKPKITLELEKLNPNQYCVLQPHPSLTIIKPF